MWGTGGVFGCSKRANQLCQLADTPDTEPGTLTSAGLNACSCCFLWPLCRGFIQAGKGGQVFLVSHAAQRLHQMAVSRCCLKTSVTAHRTIAEEPSQQLAIRTLGYLLHLARAR